MFINFFLELRQARVPVSLREYLTLIEAMRHHLADYSIDDFYYLARSALVKDERNLDKFDRVFGHHFKGIETVGDAAVEIPEEWLRKLAEKLLDRRGEEADRGAGRARQAHGDAAEAAGRAEGPASRAAASGSAPPAPRPSAPTATTPRACASARTKNRNNRAVKVWDKREFKNLDDKVEIGTRNIKVALRRLRQFAREGAAEELDLDDTIRSTARNAGWLDIKLVPERHNAAKVLLLLDIGGSMDGHIRTCEELFSAARTEFKHLEYLLFPQLPLRGAVARRLAPACREDPDAAGDAHL